MRRQRGFTLIEVLVAMTILAVGVTALVSSAGASAWRADYLRNREFGRWVAANALTELQVLPAWPEIGSKKAEVELAGRIWYVKTITRKVEDPDLRRVDVEARLDPDAIRSIVNENDDPPFIGLYLNRDAGRGIFIGGVRGCRFHDVVSDDQDSGRRV